MRYAGSLLAMLTLLAAAWAGSIDNSATRPYVDSSVATHAANTNLHIAAGNAYSIAVTGSTYAVTAGSATAAGTAAALANGTAHVVWDGVTYTWGATEDTTDGQVLLDVTDTLPGIGVLSDGFIGWWFRKTAADAFVLTNTAGTYRYSFGNGGNVHTDGVETASFKGTSTFHTVSASNIIQTSGGWDDLVNPANSLQIFAASDVTSLPVSNAIVFDTTCTTNLSNGDHVWLVVQMPHGWVTNTEVSPHIHFVQENADQTNMWFMRYKWYNTGSAVPTTWVELDTSTNQAAYTSGALHQIAEFPDVDGTHGMSSIMDIKIYRKGTTGTGKVMLKQFDIHYRRNSFGSDQEYSKSF